MITAVGVGMLSAVGNVGAVGTLYVTLDKTAHLSATLRRLLPRCAANEMVAVVASQRCSKVCLIVRCGHCNRR